MKKIILIGVSLFFCFSQVFASDLDLKREWTRLGFACRLPDGKFKIIGTQPVVYYALKFIGDNKVVRVIGFVDCEVASFGTYSISGTRLTILFDSVRKIHPNSSCIVSLQPAGKSISYDEFILKDISLYLKESAPSNLLVQQCTNGTVFQQMVQIKFIGSH